MSGFVATAPAQPADSPADSIANDGWFPDVSMAASRNAMRLDGTITDPRLRTAWPETIYKITLHFQKMLNLELY